MIVQSDSNARAGLLPVEIVEYTIGYLFNDFSTLAACSLSSPILVPTCRAVRFHSITLQATSRGPPSYENFEVILRQSPIIAQYVRQVRVLHPEDFIDYYQPLVNVLSRLVNVTEVLCLDPIRALGIDWSRCPWLLDVLSSLPVLESIAVETSRSVDGLCTSPSSQKIRKLSIFSPTSDATEANQLLQPKPCLRLSSLRLCYLRQDEEKFLSSQAGLCLDFSQLRHIGLGLGCPFSSWVSKLAALSTVSLETIVLQRESTFQVIDFPFDAVPNLTRLWLISTSTSRFTTNDFLKKCSSWLNDKFSKHPRLRELDVTIFVPIAITPENTPILDHLESNVRLVQSSSRKIWMKFFELD
ncbi:hypothetical protein DL96DRAFT_1822430 [Flagelloscypha sp. PMI_526]|nr:hypothetical protein DL96DRAFT_1822430 [Flagelloscypha sp. PMI_526]